ncbi:MAG: hypothetical protein J6U74_05560 [Clostridia bacterium]|nr:hypothetical protein [Clostridia bacterium]
MSKKPFNKRKIIASLILILVGVAAIVGSFIKDKIETEREDDRIYATATVVDYRHIGNQKNHKYKNRYYVSYVLDDKVEVVKIDNPGGRYSIGDEMEVYYFENNRTTLYTEKKVENGIKLLWGCGIAIIACGVLVLFAKEGKRRPLRMKASNYNYDSDDDHPFDD